MIVIRDNTFSIMDCENKNLLLNKKMVPSKYTLYRTFNDGGCVLFNTLHESVVVLDERETKLYCSIDDRIIDNEFDIKLYLMGFLVLDSNSEEDLINMQKSKLFFENKGIPNITILPTQECNARCAYCFADHNEKISMSSQIVNQVVQYFLTNFHSGEQVTLRWFGGEPLVAENIIDAIFDGINTAFNNELLIESIMFTNGSLLSDKIMKKAKDRWNLKKIQLTLDGYDEEHCFRKNYTSSNINYYNKVLEDISKLLNHGMAVDCRVNMDKDNITQLDYILKDLLPFKENPLFRVRVTILRPSDCGFNEFNYIAPSDLKWAYKIIYKKLFLYGFIKDIKEILPRRQRESCIAKNMNKVIIGADGNLYKCLQQVLDAKHLIGNLQTGKWPQSFVDRYHTGNFRNKCMNCVYLPLCMGGCEAYWDLQKSEMITPCIREKFFFDMILEFIYIWVKKGYIE